MKTSIQLLLIIYLTDFIILLSVMGFLMWPSITDYWLPTIWAPHHGEEVGTPWALWIPAGVNSLTARQKPRRCSTTFCPIRSFNPQSSSVMIKRKVKLWQMLATVGPGGTIPGMWFISATSLASSFPALTVLLADNFHYPTIANEGFKIFNLKQFHFCMFTVSCGFTALEL